MNRTRRHPVTLACWPVLLVLLVAAPAAAQELTLAVDVPTELQGTDYLANQTVRFESGGYSLRFDGTAESLGPEVNINALLIEDDGSFLFSTDTPFTAGTGTFDARDIVRFDGGSYSIHLDGGSLGLAPAANVDALGRDDQGRLVLSLDSPEEQFGAEYLPGDLLVLEQGDLTLLVDGAAMGLSPADNVSGLERDAGGWYLLFDAPTTVGTSTFLPGQVARWDGNAFSLEYSDPTFPAGSAGAGLSFPGSPGEVDNLLLDKLGDDVELQWTASCSSEVTDYAVYEGAIGDWTSHEPRTCSTFGATSIPVTPDPGNRFFLVVPKNGRYEGSYGADSTGSERSASLLSCLDVQRVGSCS